MSLLWERLPAAKLDDRGWKPLPQTNKFEIQMTKIQNKVLNIWIWVFEIVSDFVLRVSGFNV